MGKVQGVLAVQGTVGFSPDGGTEISSGRFRDEAAEY